MMSSNPMMSRPLLLSAAALLAVVGIIHLVEAPEYLEEQTYVGVLFILNALAAAVAVGGLLAGRGPRWAWLLGFAVAGGAFVAFILSRTVGLPSFKEEEWEGIGIVSLVVEAAFCVIAARALTARTAVADRTRPAAARPRAPRRAIPSADRS